MCFIADMLLLHAGERTCGALRADSAGRLQRLAAVHVTYGYGQIYPPENIVEEMVRQIPVCEKQSAKPQNIIAHIAGGIPGIVSFGAVYVCGRHVCHVTTGLERISIVRNGRRICTGADGGVNYAELDGRPYSVSFRLRKNDTVILHGRDVFDSEALRYVCGLISLNIKRRSSRLSYKSNAELTDMVCGAVRLNGVGNMGGAVTVITCVGNT